MKKFRRLFVATIVFAILYIGILVSLKTGVIGSCERKIDGIEKYGQSFEEFQIPADAKVVGIGEATHGNCEFQVDKLRMLKKLVETGRCKSIAFEMSPGEAAEINDAIHSENVDLAEVMSRTDYPLYDTEQMIDMITWMRDYNQGKSYEDSVVFYGVDMQGIGRDVSYLTSFAKIHEDTFSEKEIKLLNKMSADEDYDYSKKKDFFEDISKRLMADERQECKYASIICEAVIQSIMAPSFDEDSSAYSKHRDSSMAENLKSFYELEQGRGYSQIIITAHNGHVMKGEQEGYGVKAMGGFIDEIFDGSYFCVGTAYYNACVNIHVSGTFDENYLRQDFNFCSDDILAYQAKFFDGESYCLNFTEVDDTNSEVYKRIHGRGFMGLVGEGYSSLTGIRKDDRIKMIQGDRFDAVIYYYDVTPIRVLSY